MAGATGRCLLQEYPVALMQQSMTVARIVQQISIHWDPEIQELQL